MEKSTYLLLNVFLLIFWLLLALLSPSYLTAVQQQHIKTADVSLHHVRGKRSGVAFVDEGKEYFAFCRSLISRRGEDFCEEKFPLTAIELEADRVSDGLYHNSENILIIKRITWADKHGVLKEFQINESEYGQELKQLKYEHYAIRFGAVLSFLVVFYLYQRKKRRVRPTR